MRSFVRWPFTKYVGCGNDFILFDNREEDFPIQNRCLIQTLCHRQFGIGADGVILLENSSQANFRMRIFNADGSEAEMCGNGIRCLLKFIGALGFNESSYHIETLHRLLTVSNRGGEVCATMGDPTDIRWKIKISWQDAEFEVDYLDTGVPHAVLFVDDVYQIKLEEWGPFLRYHPAFKPKGTNVNLVQALAGGMYKIRTYERGVEKETLACGTGATASALAAAYRDGLQGPILIETESKELLTIGFKRDGDSFSQVTLTGPARCIYIGEVDIPIIHEEINAFQLIGTETIR